MEKNEVIIYNTDDGKTKVTLYARDGSVWMNQNQLAELFCTSKQSISYHVSNIIREKELDTNSVVKEYLTTAAMPAVNAMRQEKPTHWMSMK